MTACQVACRIYIDQRVAYSQEADKVDFTPVLRHWRLLSEIQKPNIGLEYELCERMRRYAAGLAYARGLIPRLPKGTFDAETFFSDEACRSRSLEALVTLYHRPGTTRLAAPFVESGRVCDLLEHEAYG